MKQSQLPNKTLILGVTHGGSGCNCCWTLSATGGRTPRAAGAGFGGSWAEFQFLRSDDSDVIEIYWTMASQGIFKKHYEAFLFNGLRNREVILNSILFCKIKPMITTLNLDASRGFKKIRWHRICPRSAAGMAAWSVGPFLKPNQVIGFLSSWRPGTNDSMHPLWQLPESEHLEGLHAHSHDTLPEINGTPLGG